MKEIKEGEEFILIPKIGKRTKAQISFGVLVTKDPSKQTTLANVS